MGLPSLGMEAFAKHLGDREPWPAGTLPRPPINRVPEVGVDAGKELKPEKTPNIDNHIKSFKNLIIVNPKSGPISANNG